MNFWYKEASLCAYNSFAEMRASKASFLIILIPIKRQINTKI